MKVSAIGRMNSQKVMKELKICLQTINFSLTKETTLLLVSKVMKVSCRDILPLK